MRFKIRLKKLLMISTSFDFVDIVKTEILYTNEQLFDYIKGLHLSPKV